MPTYDRAVRVLMREMVESMQLGPGQAFTRAAALKWFTTHYPRTKESRIVSHLYRLSVNNKNRLNHNARLDDDVLYQIDSTRFRRYEPATDPAPIHEHSPNGEASFEPESSEPSEPASAQDSSQFAYEHDLRDYLARNLELIESGLKLYEEEGVTGIEFPAGGRFIDILAVDAQGGYVIVELKVSRGYDRTIGQLLRYLAWIQLHHAEVGQRVRGVIVAKDVSGDLRLACSLIEGIILLEYKLSVSLAVVPISIAAHGV